MKKSLFLLLAISSIVLADDQRFTSWEDLKKPRNKAEAALVKKIESTDWWMICERYGKLRRQSKETEEFIAIRAFLTDKDYLNGLDLMNVPGRNIAIGMSVCGVYAALGQPDRINNSTNVYGSKAQFVYRNSSYRYVYTRDVSGHRIQLVEAFSN